MNWNQIREHIDISKSTNLSKSTDLSIENKLDDYNLITRYNINDLEIGMHIKYIKSNLNPLTNQYEDKIMNGGFLIEILNPSQIVNMIFILKTNIIWKMRFIKFKIYGKKKENFTNYNLNANPKHELYQIFKTEIDARKNELINEQNNKIENIIKKKTKTNIII
jgi:hypothetical protein